MNPHERWLVLGKTHTGKSTWAKTEVRVLAAQGARIVALDLTDEWSIKGRARDGVDLGPLRDRTTVAELLKTPAVLAKLRLSLAVRPDAQTSKAAAFGFETIVRLLRAAPELPPVVLVLDEAHVWAPHVTALYNDLATLGRHWGGGIAVISVSQRANRIPLTVRSQSSRIITFRQDEAPDVEGLALKTGQPFAEAAARLPPHEFLEWRDAVAPTHQLEH